MHFFIGIILAAAVAALARWGGMDRDRSFYPTVMMVIASIYVLFAAIADSPMVLVAESLIGAAFIALAFAGFRRSLWLIVVALAAHGIFDFLHPHVFHNPGVPVWWPCFSACCFASPKSPPTESWRLRSPEETDEIAWPTSSPSELRAPSLGLGCSTYRAHELQLKITSDSFPSRLTYSCLSG